MIEYDSVNTLIRFYHTEIAALLSSASRSRSVLLFRSTMTPEIASVDQGNETIFSKEILEFIWKENLIW